MSSKTPLTASASPPTSADRSGLRPRSIAPSGKLWRPLRARGNTGKPSAAIRLIALTGCRRSEILNLKWSEVDFEGSCLRLGDTKTGASHSARSPSAARAILAHLERAMATMSSRASAALTDPMLQYSPRRGGGLSAPTTRRMAFVMPTPSRPTNWAWAN